MQGDAAKVAIVGVRGFVGRHLARKCDEQGIEWINVGRISEDSGDALVETLAGCHAVVNCAGRIGGKDPEHSWFANARMPLQLAEGASKAGVANLVHLGSVASEPYYSGSVEEARASVGINPYGASKAGGELGLTQFAGPGKCEIFLVRPPAIYGPGGGGPTGMLIGAAAKGLPMPWKDFPIRRSMISVYNVVEALLRAALSEPAGGGAHNYIVTEEPPYTTAQFYDEFCRAFGYSARSFGTPGSLPLLAARTIRGPLASLTSDAIYDGSEFISRFSALPLDLAAAARLTAAEVRGQED